MKSRPKLIVVTGRPGAGKTSLSKILSESLYLPLVSRDAIKEGYVHSFGVRHDELPPDANGTATDIFFANIEWLLSNGVSLIAEAAFQHKVWESRMPALRGQGAIVFVICDVDAETAASRHLGRGLDDPKREFFHGDNRVTHFRKTGELLAPGEYVPPALDVPTIVVSTSDGYSPPLEELEALIRERLK